MLLAKPLDDSMVASDFNTGQGCQLSFADVLQKKLLCGVTKSNGMTVLNLRSLTKT